MPFSGPGEKGDAGSGVQSAKSAQSVLNHRSESEVEEGHHRGRLSLKLAPAILTDYLRANPEAAAQRDGGDRTALSYYCEGGSSHEGTLRALLGAHLAAAEVKDRAGNFPLHYLCANPRATVGALLRLVKAHPAAAWAKDEGGKCPFDFLREREIPKCAIFEAGAVKVKDSKRGFCLGGGDEDLHERMMAALRQTNAKAVEAAVEEFAEREDGDLLDLFAWQQFLELFHLSNPESGFFASELKLLFEATWSVLSHANARTGIRHKAITANLTKAVEKYVADNRNERPNLLPELITNVPASKLQKLAATRVFRELLDSHMRSGLIYIYYFEVFLFTAFMFIFFYLSVEFKFSKSVEAVWDNWVLRDTTYACLGLATYFLLREFAQLRAMHKLKLAKNWFKDGWNYIDVLASGGTIALGFFFFHAGPGPSYDHFAR